MSLIQKPRALAFLPPTKNKKEKHPPLLFGRNAFFVLDFCLDVLDRVVGLHVQRDGFSSQSLDKDLHGHFSCVWVGGPSKMWAKENVKSEWQATWSGQKRIEALTILRTRFWREHGTQKARKTKKGKTARRVIWHMSQKVKSVLPTSVFSFAWHARFFVLLLFLLHFVFHFTCFHL